MFLDYSDKILNYLVISCLPTIPSTYLGLQPSTEKLSQREPFK